MANFVQQHAHYVDFFMSGRGKKHGNFGHASAMDSILTGRDIDKSGEDPHAKFMSKFEGYAGVRSMGQRPPTGRKQGSAFTSHLDSVVWGRDVDRSGNADETFRKTFGDSAGLRGGSSPTGKSQRGIALQSTVDSVAFGHDIDQSGEDVQQRHFQTHHFDSAGVPSGEWPRSPKKGMYSMKSTVDSVAFGGDIDFSGEVPHDHFMTAFPDHAGRLTSSHPQRLPKKGAGCSLQCQLDEVIFNRDIDRSGQQTYKKYVEGFRDYAGALSDRHTQRLIKLENQLRQRQVQQTSCVNEQSMLIADFLAAAKLEESGSSPPPSVGVPASHLTSARRGSMSSCSTPSLPQEERNNSVEHGVVRFDFKPSTRTSSVSGSTRSGSMSSAPVEKPRWR
mmetsp:Transcript_77358/g.224440  ORF Transcript_77358/g.224440 Transcript_77358/m.224440 type:complete len:390 (-) Transcript_77358:83-1252(-)